MKTVFFLVAFILLTGLTVTPTMAAENSITFNPLGFIQGAYIFDFEHSIKGKGAVNFNTSIYSQKEDDPVFPNELKGHSFSVELKQYFVDAQQGGYFGLNGTYSDIEKAHGLCFIDEGEGMSFAITVGYRRIFESGLTADFGFGYGLVNREGDTEPVFILRLQTGYGW